MKPQSRHLAIRRKRLVALMFALCASAMWVSHAHSQSDPNNCGPLANHYGPHDYRTQRVHLKIVEDFHFTPEVEALIRGKSGYLGADIAYTLHTSPNHHRALMAMARLGDKLQTPKVPNAAYSVECYFDRAIRFAPDDTVVRVLYSQFLNKQKRTAEAIAQLDAAIVYAKDNGFSHYNIGLAFFDMGQYEKALAQAHKAAALGFDRKELADQLKGVNKWQEPPN